MIENDLKKLGFTDNDIAVYLTVLRRKKILPALLARETGINRSTIYGIIKSLSRRGLITEDLGGKSRYITAISPQSLSNLAKEDKHALIAKEKLIISTIDQLRLITGTDSLPIPKIRYIEEKDLSDFFHERMSTWHDSVMKQDKKWWGFQDHTLLKKYGKLIKWAWDIAPKGLELNFFSNPEPSSSKNLKEIAERHIQTQKDKEEYTTSVWIAGEYIIMISTRTDPHYLIEMHDPLLSANMRLLLKRSWDKR